MSVIESTADTMRTLSPSKLAHIVLRTNNLDTLRDSSIQFLVAKIAFEVPDVLAFLRYDQEHHRLGIIGIPEIEANVRNSNGLEVSRCIFQCTTKLTPAALCFHVQHSQRASDFVSATGSAWN